MGRPSLSADSGTGRGAGRKRPADSGTARVTSASRSASPVIRSGPSSASFAAQRPSCENDELVTPRRRTIIPGRQAPPGLSRQQQVIRPLVHPSPDVVQPPVDLTSGDEDVPASETSGERSGPLIRDSDDVEMEGNDDDEVDQEAFMVGEEDEEVQGGNVGDLMEGFGFSPEKKRK